MREVKVEALLARDGIDVVLYVYCRIRKLKKDRVG